MTGDDVLKMVSDATYEDHTIKGAEHLNFHDASVMLPGLKWLGLLRPIDGSKRNHERNRLVREFMDGRLRTEPN